MDNDLILHIRKMLLLFKALVGGKKLIKNTGIVNLKGQNSIEMDIKVEEMFVDYLKNSNLPVSVFSEENGVIPIHKKPEYVVAFDPLDGSTNYKSGNGLLPYGCLIAFYKGNSPKLKDVAVSGATEITRDLSWIFDGKSTRDLTGKKVSLYDNWQITQSTPAYLDLYYKTGYEAYSSFQGKMSIRNTGSVVGNLSYLLSNVSCVLGGICMRPEEIGAVYSLIKGAGGIVVDHSGKDLGDMNFDPKAAYPMLAGVKEIINFCIKELNYA